MKHKYFTSVFPKSWMDKHIPSDFPEVAFSQERRKKLVKEPLKLNICWNCRTEDERFCCKGCNIARYCSQICQEEHWRAVHTSHCKYLAGEKTAQGSSHTKDCRTCKMQTSDYKHLQKRNKTGLACHLKMVDKKGKDDFIQAFIAIAKYHGDYDKMAEHLWDYYGGRGQYFVNPPFGFGEITGTYLDYLDKLLGMLQCLYCFLVHRYPGNIELGEIKLRMLSVRAFHWVSCMQTTVQADRIALTLRNFWYYFPADQLIDLHNELGPEESQNGPTVLHTFCFLYEMLGIWAFLHPLMGMDIDSFDEVDISSVRHPRPLVRFVGTGEGPEDLQIHKTPPIYDLVSQLKTNFENLTIWDKNFRLLPFRQITEQFETQQLKENPKGHLFSCELCSKDVDPSDSVYVFHYLVTFDYQLRTTAQPSIEAMALETDRCSFKRLSKCISQLTEGIPYTTYVIGQGMATVCNQGSCWDAYPEEIFESRSTHLLWSSLTMSKYVARFADLQCWYCKILSRKCHRCSSCKSRFYCSAECQTNDWKNHKKICRMLQEAGSQMKSDPKERRILGDKRAEEVMQTAAKGCRCMERGHHCILHGRLGLLIDQKKYEGEVD